MLTSRPAEMGTKGDGATITHETEEGGKDRESEGERERGGGGEGEGRGERGEGEGEGERYFVSFTVFSFSL